MFRLYGFLLLYICVSLSLGSPNYCSLCKDHTMCTYPTLGPNCKDAGGSGVSDDDKNVILKVHNELRSRVALGNEKRGAGGSQPQGSNMMKLNWDNDLAEVAQRWADQCTLSHDTCRKDPRWQVGQNIFWKQSYPNPEVNWTEAITTWYNEVEIFNPKYIASYFFDGATGHYTQLVWHDTELVGCGRREYGHSSLYVCNYGPAGNYINEPLYVPGQPCSKCPANSACEQGLCTFKISRAEQPRMTPNTTTETEEFVDDSNEIDESNSSGSNEPDPEISSRSENRFSDESELYTDVLIKLENLKSQLSDLIENVIRKTKLKKETKKRF